MLQSLHIHNFALIEDLHLTFGDGITIFSGETGAGKSILLDAIGMLAGKRASASFVRQGAESFLVEGSFFLDTVPEALAALLCDNHVEMEEQQLIISRQFYRNGRGTTLINGTIIPITVVRKLGEYVLDIHGQFDNRLIFDAAYHVQILDHLTQPVQQAREAYDVLYGQWRTLRARLKELQRDESEKARLLSVLDFQIKEIEEAQLRLGEDEELERKVRMAAHAEHIKNNVKDALFSLEGSERQKGLVDLIEGVQRSVEKASAYDDLFKGIAAKVEGVVYEIEDIHDEIARYADSFEFDERGLDAMQSRLSLIDKLKRKYGITIEEIVAFLQQAKEKYERLQQSETFVASLQQDIADKEKELRDQAAQLLALRSEANQLFKEKMEGALHALGMARASITFHIVPMTAIQANGADEIELYFSANTGEDMKALAKIASGGEISRIALALKTSTRQVMAGQTMIFDEIDVGISGQTGLQVADHIRRLRQRGQVFCITHLPQTASIADHHFFIYKEEVAGRTISQVRTLSDEEHIQEIARMFAGNDTTEASIETARQLVKQVKK